MSHRGGRRGQATERDGADAARGAAVDRRGREVAARLDIETCTGSDPQWLEVDPGLLPADLPGSAAVGGGLREGVIVDDDLAAATEA